MAHYLFFCKYILRKDWGYLGVPLFFNVLIFS